MVKVAIVFHSRSGNVFRLASAAADAVREAGGEPKLFKVPELPDPMVLDKDAYAELAEETRDVAVATLEDLAAADAIMFGTPVHFGLPAPQILDFVDRSGPVAIPGRLADKVATVFASGSAAHAGAQTAILALHNVLCHWGCLIVPNGSSVEVLASPHNGSPYGTCSISRHAPNNVHEDNIKAVEYQALRLVEVTTAYRTGLARQESAIEHIDLGFLMKKFPRLSVN